MLYNHAANVSVLARGDRVLAGVTEEALGKLSLITQISNKALGDRKNWRFLRQTLAGNFTPKRANPTCRSVAPVIHAKT